MFIVQVNPELIEKFESKNMIFVGHDEDGQRMEMLELKGQKMLHEPFWMTALLEYFTVHFHNI